VAERPSTLIAGNVVNNSGGQPIRCCPSARVMGEVVTSSLLKHCYIYKLMHVSRTAIIILQKEKRERTINWELAM
jgi:hypothetical protein